MEESFVAAWHLGIDEPLGLVRPLAMCMAVVPLNLQGTETGGAKKGDGLSIT